MRNFAVIIPAYNPMPELPHYISYLIDNDVKQIIVINDGNNSEYAALFEEIRLLNRVIVLDHSENKGKGAGLRTAFSYLQKSYSSLDGAVTADADGQHLGHDVLRVGDQLIEGNDEFVLGIRDFSEEGVPLRSKLGNRTSSLIFKWLFGYYLLDTQTGLRGAKMSEIPWLSRLSGDGFDYEINMLIQMAQRNKSVKELKIETVYHDEHTSNYSTVKDSLAIGVQLLKGYYNTPKEKG